MECKLLKFHVSAPGKVILHGEHAVVYGKPAIAAAIGSRTHLVFTEHSSDKEGINISFQTLNFVVRLDVGVLNALLGNLEHMSINWTNYQEHQRVLDTITRFINEQLLITKQDEEIKFKTTLSVLYIMCGILLSKKIANVINGFTVDLSSEIKVGAGLGSSASFAVCLAASFLILARRDASLEDVLLPESMEFISEWALNSERIMHGKPSGLDNAICTFGGFLKFTKGHPIEQINMPCSLSILLVDSQVSRSTANLVEKVAELKQRFPKLVDSVLISIGNCVEEAAILYGSKCKTDEAFFKKLSDLFQVNNGLLRAIGVSHCSLEQIFLIAQMHGFASKITGAGGGGYAIILLPHDYKGSRSFKSLCSDLEKSNFSWSETIIGDAGIKVFKI